MAIFTAKMLSKTLQAIYQLGTTRVEPGDLLGIFQKGMRDYEGRSFESKLVEALDQIHNGSAGAKGDDRDGIMLERLAMGKSFHFSLRFLAKMAKQHISDIEKLFPDLRFETLCFIAVHFKEDKQT